MKYYTFNINANIKVLSKSELEARENIIIKIKNILPYSISIPYIYELKLITEQEIEEVEISYENK